MAYTIDTVPHLMCRHCKFFSIFADMDGHESKCKRIDHKKVKFYKSPFASYNCGEAHCPCGDFQPAHPDYADFKDDWTSMEEVWPVFRDAWMSGVTMPHMMAFHVNGDYSVDYLVPFELFYDGGMIEDGVLKATIRRTQVRDRIDHGVQLYRLSREAIGGVVIDTGEVLPAP